MTDSYFVIGKNKYIVIYENRQVKILKMTQDGPAPLSNEEDKKIQKLLNDKYSYVYNSDLLEALIESNNEIENKPYVLNLINWLESIIPYGHRNNLYRNIGTLHTELNLNVELVKRPEEQIFKEENSTAGGYDTRNNKIIIYKESLLELWQLAQFSKHPEEFYWNEYRATLLHELAHLSSSNHNKKTGITLCGFDKFPAEKQEEENRGLTEGFTELIVFTGIPGRSELSSKYYFEASLVFQLIQIVGIDVFKEGYFSNLGISPIQEKLQRYIEDEDKSFKLFRDIELNFLLRYSDENIEQSVLGNIQSAILDYLEVKLKRLLQDGNFDVINQIIHNYQLGIITTSKLKMMLKDPKHYVGIEENQERFKKIKEEYNSLLTAKKASSQIKR